MRIRHLCALPLVLGCAACGGGSSSAPVPHNAVAVIDATSVPVAEYDRLIRDAERQYAQRQKPFPQPGTAAYAKVRDQTVSYLVHAAEIEQKAAEMGISVSRADVTRALNGLKKSQFHGDERAYEAARDAQGLTEEDIRANERSQLLSRKLYDRVTAGTTIGDQALRDYYALHQANYLAPDSRIVRHVLVRTKPEAEQIISRLKAGASFEQLERASSLDEGPGRFLMPISRGDTVPDFEAVAFKLKIGQISKPVKTSFGWHVVQALTPVRKSAVLPFPAVRPAVRELLLKQRRGAAMDHWLVAVQKLYCSGPERVRYAAAYRPEKDPCKALPKG